MSSGTIDILLVDDHQIFRGGLRMLLEGESNYRVIGETSSGREMLNFLHSADRLPDVVLLDIAMPEMDGIRAAREALKCWPALRIVTLSLYSEEDYYFSLLTTGVKGFLLKNSDIHDVLQAIDTVATGGTYYAPELIGTLVGTRISYDEQVTPPSENIVLSDREQQVIVMICRGLTTIEIAEALSLSKRTVDKHRANIMEKTGTKNSAHLVTYAIRHNLVDF